MKLNFKETIHQRTDEELNRITKDYHFYSAAERAIAQNEITKRGLSPEDLAKYEKKIASLAKNEVEDEKGKSLKMNVMNCLIAAAVIGAVIFIWNYRPTTYVVERRLVPISALNLSDEAHESLMSSIFEGLNFVVVDIERAAVQGNATINGVTWAASNVDAPGTFAAYPEDFGMHFQWNRRKGWNSTDRVVEGWNNVAATGTTWYAENDPCPEGWRVPTWDEFDLLYQAGSVWASLNGVQGRLFGDAPNQVFLPAAGWRFYNNGRLDVDNPIRQGIYWGDDPFRYLVVSSFSVTYFEFGANASGYSVRCVAKN